MNTEFDWRKDEDDGTIHGFFGDGLMRPYVIKPRWLCDGYVVKTYLRPLGLGYGEYDGPHKARVTTIEEGKRWAEEHWRRRRLILDAYRNRGERA